MSLQTSKGITKQGQQSLLKRKKFKCHSRWREQKSSNESDTSEDLRSARHTSTQLPQDPKSMITDCAFPLSLDIALYNLNTKTSPDVIIIYCKFKKTDDLILLDAFLQ